MLSRRVLQAAVCRRLIPTSSGSISVASGSSGLHRSTIASLYRAQSTSASASHATGSYNAQDLPASLLRKGTTASRSSKPRQPSSSSPSTSPSTAPPTSAAPSTTTAEGTAASPASSAASPSSSSPSSPTSSSPPANAREAGPASDSFHSLKGTIDYSIYKALTDRPFRFEKMSAVQEKVLNLLPELAYPTARGADPASTTTPQSSDTSTRGSRDIGGTDLLIKAKTGTGKTLAFLVPAVEARQKDLEQEAKNFKEKNPGADKHTVSRHMAHYSQKSVGTIILSPTRELATQIATEATRLLYHKKDWGVQLFIGGASKRAQMMDFRRYRRDIVVATPGRMADMLKEPDLQGPLREAKMLILDEADTLLDMGFKDELNRIVDQLPEKDVRQTFMFSATVSKDIQRIARSFLRPKYNFVDCVPEHETNTHLHIPQFATLSSPKEQIPHVYRLLAHDALLHPEGGKAIVFLPTTKMTQLFAIILDQLRSYLPFGRRGTKVFEMHSKKTQTARDRTADSFRQAKGGYSILVTSDVSARGVDYPGVTRVIQVGIPTTSDNYVHRLGRTGRAGKAGRGDLVLLPWEQKYLSGHLAEMPIKPMTTEGFQGELEKLAEEFDANPVKPSAAAPASPSPRDARRDRHSRFGPTASALLPAINTPVLPTISSMSSKISDEVIPQLAETEIEEAFGSQLGFYIGHADELRLHKMDILQHLKNWTTEGLGMSEAPYVSQDFLNKLGIRERRSPAFSSPRRGGGGSARGDSRGFSRGGGGSGSFYGGGGRFDERERRGQTHEYIRSERTRGNPAFPRRRTFDRNDFAGKADKPTFRSSINRDGDRYPF